jgi:predicted O-linked N-acetylglucosamine transferase (SPINDLY family)
LAKKARKRGDIKEADQQCRALLKKDPNNYEAIILMGEMAYDLNQFGPAKTFFKWAIRINPELIDAHYGLGHTFEKLGDKSSAMDAYKRCVQIEPKHAAGRTLAKLLHQFGFANDAIALYNFALQHDPDNPFIYESLSLSLNSAGETKKALDAVKRSLELKPDFRSAMSNHLLISHYDPDITPEQRYTLHKEYMEAVTQPNSSEAAPRYNDHKKIRVGYVSADFHIHSVTDFFDPLLSNHDHSKYEIFCYYNNGEVDIITEKLMSLADHWTSVVGITDEALKNIIQTDEIDILVDLTGHMGNNRLSVFSLRPAPVQVTWLGYPNTTGVAEIDFRLTDEIADPVGASEHLHTERLVRITTGFLCYRCAEDATIVPEIPSKTKGVFTFGSFNNIAKVSTEVINVWAQILSETSNSRIILKGHQFIDQRVKQRYLKLFKEAGVESNRVILLPLSENRQEHLELYNQVDLALDTFPYNGTTTTCEALWMGVPTLTYKGNSHVSRVSASILNRVKLDEFVASGTDEYIEKAMHHAKAPARLSTLRHELRKTMINSDLCNGKLFAEQVERAYQEMLRL